VPSRMQASKTRNDFNGGRSCMWIAAQQVGVENSL
jgi:hypothetical protein